MSQPFISGRVRCPFWLNSVPAKGCGGYIACEGPIANTQLRLCYESKKDRKQQEELYCIKNYICCEIYRMLMDSKYQEEKDAGL